jgi:hypothetical protein
MLREANGALNAALLHSSRLPTGIVCGHTIPYLLLLLWFDTYNFSFSGINVAQVAIESLLVYVARGF